LWFSDATKRDERTTPRLIPIETRIAHEALGLQIDVEADLLIHARFRGAAREQEARSRASAFDPAHAILQ
jgi:hypothetical protein